MQRDPSWDGIRLFVSSTFRDMQAERQELVAHVFPRLRMLCTERGLAWREVDLRWGVTEQEAQGNRAIPICLAEVGRCRPYFIGLLGERYGWVPEEIPAALLEREPWLARHLGKSVTEMEILHFAATGHQQRGPKPNAFFYLRDPQYILDLPPERRADHMEGPTAEEISRLGTVEAERRADDRSRRLAKLKDRLRASGVPVHEDYSDPRALAALVLRDLTAVINSIAPASLIRDPIDNETAYHEAFAASRREVFVGRSDVLRRLDQQAAGSGRMIPIVISGDPGSGKSALLAYWARRQIDTHPGKVVLTHFVGASPNTGDSSSMLRRLMTLFQRRCNIQVPLPADGASAAIVRDSFPRFLRAAAGKGQITLIIDGLDRLPDAAINLPWLADIPSGICVIVATGSGPELDALRERKFPVLWLPLLTTEERSLLVRTYLGQYGKSLKPEYIKKIAGNALASNPRFMMLLLEELRATATHESLGETIDSYLSANSIDDLYMHMFRRFEQLYETDLSGLVGNALRLLWASRGGLSETELLDRLGTKNIDDNSRKPLPQAYWSGLYLSLRPVLQDDHGLLRFADPEFRRAVAKAYLQSPQAERESHEALADYFNTLFSTARPDTGEGAATRSRAISELPWQLERAGAWTRLRELLSRPDVLPVLWQASAAQVRAWWVQVAQNTGIPPHKAYEALIRSPAKYTDAAWVVATLLDETGRHDDAASIRRKIATEASASSQVNLADDSGPLDLTLDLAVSGDTLDGLDLASDAEDVNGKGSSAAPAAGDSDVAISLDLDSDPDDSGPLDLSGSDVLELDDDILLSDDHEVGLFSDLDDSGAIELTLLPKPPHKAGSDPKPIPAPSSASRAEPVKKTSPPVAKDEAAGRRGRAMVNEAISFGSRQDYSTAISMYKQADPLLRAAGDAEGLQACLGNLGAMLLMTNDFGGAEAAFKQQEVVCRACGNRVGLAQAAANRGVALRSRGDHEGARLTFVEAERMARENGDAEGTANALLNRATVTTHANEAERLLRDAEQIYRRQGMLHRLGTCLAHRGKLLLKAGELKVAADIFREAMDVCAKTQDGHGQAMAAFNLALVLSAMNDLGPALQQYQTAGLLSRGLNDRPGILSALIGQAEVLVKQKSFDRALAACTEAEPIAQALGAFNETRQIQALVLTIQSGRASQRAPQATLDKMLAGPGNAEAKSHYMIDGVIIDATSPEQAMAIAGARQHLAAANKAAQAGHLQLAMGEIEHALRVGADTGDPNLIAAIQARKGELLAFRGSPKDAMEASRQAVKSVRNAGPPKALAEALARAADLACATGHHDEAMAMRKEQEAICKRNGDSAGAASAAMAQAEVMLAAGDLKEAYEFTSELSKAAMANGDNVATFESALLLSKIFRAGGEAEHASQLAEVAVTGFRQAANRPGVARALCQVGLLQLFDLKKPALAEKALREAEAVARAEKIDFVVAAVLGARAEISFQAHKFDEAATLLDDEITFCRQLPNQQGLAQALNRRVDAELCSFGLRSKKIDAQMREAEEVARATGNIACLLTSLRRQRDVAKGRSDFGEALQIVNRAERVARDAGDAAAVAEFLRDRAQFAGGTAQVTSAAATLAEAEGVSRRAGDAVGAAVALAEQAALHRQAGRTSDALKLYTEAARVFGAHNRRQELAACQAAEASIRIGLGETDVPARLLAEAEPVFRQLNDRQNLGNCLANKLDVMERQGASSAEIIKVLKELHTICRQTGDREALAAHLARYADLRMRTPEGMNAIVADGATPQTPGILRDIFDSFAESERLLVEVGNFDAAARVMISRANVMCVMQGRGSEAFGLAQKAMRMANDNGLVDLARELMPLIERIRSQAGIR